MSKPFAHDELEVKRHFLNLARKYQERSKVVKDDEEDLAFELAAALLYMNVADYLAEYVLNGVSTLSQEAVSKYYFGVIESNPAKKKQINIGDSMKRLERYEFPRKVDIIKKLGEVNSSRKKVAHQILKVKAEELIAIDQAVTDLATSTEELIEIIDEIQIGMPPKNLTDLININNEDSRDEPKKS